MLSLSVVVGDCLQWSEQLKTIPKGNGYLAIGSMEKNDERDWYGESDGDVEKAMNSNNEGMLTLQSTSRNQKQTSNLIPI